MSLIAGNHNFKPGKFTSEKIQDIIHKTTVLARRFFKFRWMSKKFWIRLFLTLIAVIVVQKVAGVSYISDTMALGSMGFISALIGMYNMRTVADVKSQMEGTHDTND
jgi:hypothetical protein